MHRASLRRFRIEKGLSSWYLHEIKFLINLSRTQWSIHLLNAHGDLSSRYLAVSLSFFIHYFYIILEYRVDIAKFTMDNKFNKILISFLKYKVDNVKSEVAKGYREML